MIFFNTFSVESILMTDSLSTNFLPTYVLMFIDLPRNATLSQKYNHARLLDYLILIKALLLLIRFKKLSWVFWQKLRKFKSQGNINLQLKWEDIDKFDLGYFDIMQLGLTLSQPEGGGDSLAPHYYYRFPGLLTALHEYSNVWK